MKRKLYLLLVLILCLSTLYIGCASDETTSKTTTTKSTTTETTTTKETTVESNLNPAGVFPIVKEPVTLRVLAPQHQFTEDLATNWVSEWYEEHTNVKIEWEAIVADAADRINLLLASGTELPDIIMMHRMGAEEVASYGSQGLFIALNDLIDDYGYGVNLALDYKPEILNYITAPDGNIYGLFSGVEFMHVNYRSKLWINQVWLDNLGLDMPTTTDEFYQVLKAFKQKDANNNDDPNDEVPLIFENWPGNIPANIMNSFIYTSPNKNLNLVGDVVVPAFAQDGWREGLRYLRKLYAEGLIDQEVFTSDPGSLRAMSENPEGNQVGAASHVGLAFTDIANTDTKLEYVIVPPLEGPTGLKQSAYSYRGATMEFFITNACEEPEVAFRWGDGIYLNPKYGGPYKNIGFWELNGPEDVAWRFAEPGEVDAFGNQAVWAELIGYGQVHNTYWMMGPQYVAKDGVFSSMVVDPEIWNHDAVLLSATVIYEQYDGGQTLPPVTVLENDVREFQDIHSALNEFKVEATAQFIVGIRDINSEQDWNEYLEELNRIGIDRYVEIHQDAYDNSPWVN